MTDATATATGRPPLWRDVRVLAWAFQIVVVAVVVAVVWWLFGNYQRQRPQAGPEHRVVRRSSTSRPASRSRRARSARRSATQDAIVEGLFNTLRLAITGIVLATSSAR